MFLRSNRRFKNGKEHRYWNIVENRRCASGKVVQRQVLYLGEIDDGQHDDWSRAIESALQERQGAPLLEHRREPALCQWQGGAAAGAVFG
jgi:hypothetical protein